MEKQKSFTSSSESKVKSSKLTEWLIRLICGGGGVIATIFVIFIQARLAPTTAEQVKIKESIAQKRYEACYEACIQALSLIDAQFSHTLTDPNGQPISKQYVPIDKARECHSKLILSCENPEIVKEFAGLVIYPTKGISTDNLNTFRNLVRKELGFGEEIKLDRELAYFGRLICENPQVDTDGLKE
jgi:hypothetical protein